MSFDDFKNKMKNKNSFNTIQEKIKESSSGNDYTDDRQYKFRVDSSGNGQVVIRFLPEPDGEDLPYQSWYQHAFKENDNWYIERSRTSLGKGVPDPVSEANTELWKTGIESNKNLARARKRKLRYISNIQVIKDPLNPENEGKCFLWEYGPAIYKFIEEAFGASKDVEFDALGLDDEEEQREPFNPFCFFGGANFKLVAYIASNGFRSYDKSKWLKNTEFADGDEDAMREVYDNLYSLEAENDDSKYKSYDELKKRFDIVVGNTVRQVKTDDGEDDDFEQIDTTVSNSDLEDEFDEFLNI